MVADECLSPSDFLAFLTNSLKLLCEIKGSVCFCCSFCIFRKEFCMRIITSSSVSLGEVLTNILVPRNATLFKLFLIDVGNTLFAVYVFPHS